MKKKNNKNVKHMTKIYLFKNITQNYIVPTECPNDNSE